MIRQRLSELWTLDAVFPLAHSALPEACPATLIWVSTTSSNVPCCAPPPSPTSKRAAVTSALLFGPRITPSNCRNIDLGKYDFLWGFLVYETHIVIYVGNSSQQLDYLLLVRSYNYIGLFQKGHKGLIEAHQDEVNLTKFSCKTK